MYERTCICTGRAIAHTLSSASHFRAPSIEDSSKVIFLFLNENICCDPSLEPSWQDGSNDGS